MEEALEKMIDLKSDLAAQCIRRLQVLFFMGSFPDGNTPYISQPQICDKNDICNQLFIITELKICHLSIHQSLISSEISKNTNLHHVFVDKRKASPGDCKIYENYRTQEVYCVSKLVMTSTLLELVFLLRLNIFHESRLQVNDKGINNKSKYFFSIKNTKKHALNTLLTNTTIVSIQL